MVQAQNTCAITMITAIGVIGMFGGHCKKLRTKVDEN